MLPTCKWLQMETNYTSVSNAFLLAFFYFQLILISDFCGRLFLQHWFVCSGTCPYCFCFRQVRHNPCGIQETLDLGEVSLQREWIRPCHSRYGLGLILTLFTPKRVRQADSEDEDWAAGWESGPMPGAAVFCPLRRCARQETSEGAHSNHSQPLHNLGEGPPTQPSTSLNNDTWNLLLSCLKVPTYINPSGISHFYSTFPHSSHHSHKS